MKDTKQQLLPPLALYIHIPWCVRKCPYCDFNSHAVRGEIPETEYVKALLADLTREQNAAQGRSLSSIFIGGGTPSLFSAKAIADILQGVEKIVPFSADIEITMEANPGTFERERFAGFKAAGVTRLSIGVQSFNDQHLAQLGRIHSGGEAIAAIESARTLGFAHLNIDLMHGLADQDSSQALQDLSTAIELGSDHLSWYQLTIEPNTEFYARPPKLPDLDILWDIQQEGQALIASAGFSQYEISAYAKPNARARHNINYWQFGDYFGIGAGAHGKLSFYSEDSGALEITRRWKKRSPKAYLSSVDPLGGQHIVAAAELPFEFMMNALRLMEGAPVDYYSQRTGLPFSSVEKALLEAQAKGLIKAGDRIAPTERGALFLNDLLEYFV
ncbi:MAG: radical SAM family heme chaperone HemW [Oceanospirillaceae bacterium]|nr:radical SAM family heme chaperone HemW [Oceanospirillaceae bacterium]